MSKLVSSDGWCFYCGGNGFEDKICPSCGREPVKASMNLDKKTNIDKFLTGIDELGIPSKYQGVIWNAEFLRHYHKDKEKDNNFARFVEQLEKINDVFAQGLLSEKSVIIIAPAGYSKMTFAFSCMQRALDNKYSVAPLLDTVELKRLLSLASEKPNYKLYNSIDYDTYVISEVCFVTVTKLPQHEWAYEVIQELFDRRTRLGLSTFIISRFDLSEISKRDYANQFETIVSAQSSDSFKYPAVIRYRKIY